MRLPRDGHRAEGVEVVGAVKHHAVDVTGNALGCELLGGLERKAHLAREGDDGHVRARALHLELAERNEEVRALRLGGVVLIIASVVLIIISP